MKKVRAGAFLLPLCLFLGCKMKPTKVTRFSGPSTEVFYTVETWEDNGAISSDFTRVFAHFEHNGKSDKVMFLDGAYLALSSVRWSGKDEATICISEGRVNSFKDTLTLKAGGESYSIRNRLDPACRQQQ